MRAYKRADGNYDIYNVEPQIITAEEFAKIQERERLTKRKKELMAELESINAKLGEVPLKESAAVTEQEAPVTVVRKRW